MLESGSNINDKVELPLSSAAQAGRSDMVEFLISKGADLTVADETGLTALHYASASLSLGSLRVVLDHGANPNLVNDNSYTLLQVVGISEIGKSRAAKHLEDRKLAVHLLQEAASRYTSLGPRTQGTNSG